VSALIFIAYDLFMHSCANTNTNTNTFVEPTQFSCAQLLFTCRGIAK